MPFVLVVEDDQFFRETIELALKKEGVEVKTVKDGEEAISEVKSRRPDLMLLDLLMPRMDGFAVLEYLHENDVHLPVVVLSNLSEDVDTDKCFSLGAVAHLIKSDMDDQDLWPRIRGFLPSSSRE